MKTYTITTFDNSEIHTEQVPMPAPEPFAFGRSRLYWPVMAVLITFILTAAIVILHP